MSAPQNSPEPPTGPSKRRRSDSSRPPSPPPRLQREDAMYVPPNRVRDDMHPNDEGPRPSSPFTDVPDESEATWHWQETMFGCLYRPRKEVFLSSDVEDPNVALYEDPAFILNLADCGGYMTGFKGISMSSVAGWQALYRTRKTPEVKIFSAKCFATTMKRLEGQREACIISCIGHLIVPAPDLSSTWGFLGSKTFRMDFNLPWIGAKRVLTPRPRPNHTVGFKRDVFTKRRLCMLDQVIGDPHLREATVRVAYDMYFPFLTAECQSDLDIADRKNAHSQTIHLFGLFDLYRKAGREAELNGQLNGFSVSYNDREVRIWGHLLEIDGRDPTSHRFPITAFVLTEGRFSENRWSAWNFVMNIYDWAKGYLDRICSVIDTRIALELQPPAVPPDFLRRPQCKVMRDLVAAVAAKAAETNMACPPERRPRMGPLPPGLGLSDRSGYDNAATAAVPTPPPSIPED